ncbi:MAG TPA: carbamoyltransferase C-terminal domain-containing protein [Actinomycetes bacterium]|nr:carbamoyltransferase C-terminal domain-containing protein [Actinomycetes bacterium]
MHNVLGINCFSHDTSACLLQDGRIVAFVEEERFNRERHTKRFPDSAIAFCLQQAGIGMRQVDVVAFAHRPGLDFARGALDALRRGSPKRLAVQAYVDANLVRKERAFRRRWGCRGTIAHVGHHDAHAASAFFASPFDQAAVLTLDRGGDFLSTTLQHGRGSRLQLLATVRNPDSLGEVYSALTWYLGFRPNADEGKVMGLAPYGRDKLVSDLAGLVRRTPDGLFRVNLEWFAYQREGGWLSGRFRERYGPPRVPESEITELHQDLAHGVQDLIEEAALHVARSLRARTGSRNLCLAGGVALNSVMNTRLLQEAGFEEVFIQPAASDAGNALGAALWVWHHQLGRPREEPMRHAFWGPEFPARACAEAARGRGLTARAVADAPAEAARLLADSRIVGWYQGRAEVGPRALGARSILADPRRPDMKDIVNARVKRREAFRPFAPSVLHERGPEWFGGYYPNPFMLLVLPVRRDKQEAIPAVTHVDGSARLQTVTEGFNPPFYRLIGEFERRTGVPVVLNTSFNLRGEPIVLRPAEAVEDFLRSDMDALFLGDLLAEKVRRA